MVVSIRMTEEEKALATSYAKIRGMSLSEAIKRAYFEAIEDEYDMKVIAEYEEAKKQGKVKTYSHEEVWGENEI